MLVNETRTASSKSILRTIQIPPLILGHTCPTGIMYSVIEFTKFVLPRMSHWLFGEKGILGGLCRHRLKSCGLSKAKSIDVQLYLSVRSVPNGFGFNGFHFVCLASGAFGLGRGGGGEQAGGFFYRAFGEGFRARFEFRIALHVGDVALHIFRRPTATVGDKRELRKVEAEFGEEHQHLPRYRLNVVLPARDDE